MSIRDESEVGNGFRRAVAKMVMAACYRVTMHHHHVSNSDRTQKLKDAKSDAAADIESYKKQKEEQFSKSKNADSGSNSKAEAAADESAKSELAEIKKAGDKSQKEVLQKLIDEVLTPKPVVHINA